MADVRSNILELNDDPLILDLVELFLVVFGVTIARDGAQARKLLRSSRPDLVVLDVAKPGLDGLATLRWIRNQRRPHQTTVRMLTALAHSAQMRSVA